MICLKVFGRILNRLALFVGLYLHLMLEQQEPDLLLLEMQLEQAQELVLVLVLELLQVTGCADLTCSRVTGTLCDSGWDWSCAGCLTFHLFYSTHTEN